MNNGYKKIIVLSIIFIFIVLPNITLAGKAKVEWNANTESDLAGYRVYYGTTPRNGNAPPGGYTAGPINVGNVTTYETPNLNGGQRYYFSVVAVDTSNNVSNFSSEVNKTIMAGDIDNNKIVNSIDFQRFLENYGNTDCANLGNIIGFEAGNCEVDIFDFNQIAQDYNKTTP